MIKRAELRDVPAIAPLFDQYRVFYDQISDVELAKCFLEERIQKDQSVLYYAQLEGTDQLIGFVQLYPSFSSVSAQPLWILNDLFVTENVRRSGAGRALLREAARMARLTGAKGLSLSTSGQNKAAQKLYESEGYIRDTVYWHYDLQISQED